MEKIFFLSAGLAVTFCVYAIVSKEMGFLIPAWIFCAIMNIIGLIIRES